MEEFGISTFAERPELVDYANEIEAGWPEFTGHDAVCEAFWDQIIPTFPGLCVVATDAQGAVAARGRAIPFRLHTAERGGKLPDRGWDQVIIWGMADHVRKEPSDTVSALEIAVDVKWRGHGLSATMLHALRTAAAGDGFTELVAPVRPSGKHERPHVPIAEYVAEARTDGLPVDPWLRVHLRAGGVIDGIAPASMVIAGSLIDWRQWTGLPFDFSGLIEVPGALLPVRCEHANDYAVYVEPNVWVRHDTAG